MLLISPLLESENSQNHLKKNWKKYAIATLGAASLVPKTMSAYHDNKSKELATRKAEGVFSTADDFAEAIKHKKAAYEWDKRDIWGGGDKENNDMKTIDKNISSTSNKIKDELLKF